MNKYFYRGSGADGTRHKKETLEDITSKNTSYFRDNLELSISYGWCDEQGNPIPLTYRHDDYGFRNDYEYGPGKPLALGCSDTYGIGNKVEHRWSNVLESRIGEQVTNLGIPGGSIKGCYRVLKAYLERFTPSKVFLLLPNVYRTEYLLDGKTEQIGPNFVLTAFTKQLFANVFTEEENVYHEANGYLDAIKGICLEKNIKLIGIPNPTFEHYGKMLELGFEKSYDLQHLGPKFQSYIADIFFDHLQRQDFGIANYSDRFYKYDKKI